MFTILFLLPLMYVPLVSCRTLRCWAAWIQPPSESSSLSLLCHRQVGTSLCSPSYPCLWQRGPQNWITKEWTLSKRIQAQTLIWRRIALRRILFQTTVQLPNHLKTSQIIRSPGVKKAPLLNCNANTEWTARKPSASLCLLSCWLFCTTSGSASWSKAISLYSLPPCVCVCLCVCICTCICIGMYTEKKSKEVTNCRCWPYVWSSWCQYEWILPKSIKSEVRYIESCWLFSVFSNWTYPSVDRIKP